MQDFFGEESRDQYLDRLFGGQRLVFSCCSGIALKWIILKEKNLALSELLEALEKPLWPESWQDLSLQKEGHQVPW